MKAGVSSKAEPPIKKQKRVSSIVEDSIVEDEADVERKGANEKEGTEDFGNNRALLSIMHHLEKISSKLDNNENRFEKFEERLTRIESRDINITDLVRVAVQEYFSNVPEQSLSLPPPPPPPPQNSFPQASITSPPAKASVNSPPVKAAKKNLVDNPAFGTAAQATDVDFVTVSPSKDPAVGRGCRVRLKVKGDEVKEKDTEKAELAKKEATPKKAELAKKEAAPEKADLAKEAAPEKAELAKKEAAPMKAELKQEAGLSRKETVALKRKEMAEFKKK